MRRGPVAPQRGARRTGGEPRGYLYLPDYVSAAERADVLAWLATLHPIWEMRYPTSRPPPVGKQQRPLLRPVYWLGNWQFACLDYYHPPKGIANRCVAAEPYPKVLAAIVARAEALVRAKLAPSDIPPQWHLNTCLVNFYGNREVTDAAGKPKWVDCARVGEHRDFEPGPVVSLSFGERALLQFIPHGRHVNPAPVKQEWLADRSLQVFGGAYWKDETLHRVQRVETKTKALLGPAIEGFATRRINFTFRYVPVAHVVPYAKLSAQARHDVHAYMQQLATHSPFFAAALRSAPDR